MIKGNRMGRGLIQIEFTCYLEVAIINLVDGKPCEDAVKVILELLPSDLTITKHLPSQAFRCGRS